MLAYNTPSTAVFQSRRRFHSEKKSNSESTSDWFKRLQKSVSNCDFDHISDYMLIDKFVSGLNETDFDKFSKVSKWTVEELILVVLGNTHIFSTKDSNLSNESNRIQEEGLKSKQEVNQNDEYLEEIDADQVDHDGEEESFHEEPIGDISELNQSNKDINPNERTASKTRKLSNTEKNKRHIEKLKVTGRYDEYRRKHAECAKKRRLKLKQTEQYLPPEMQLHVMNERRRMARERTRRFRERKSQQKSQIVTAPVEPNIVWMNPSPKYEPDFENGTKSQHEPDHDIDCEIKIENEPEIDHEFEIQSQPKKSLRLRERTKGKKDEMKVVTKSKQKSTYKRKRTFECYLCSSKISHIYELKTHMSIFHPVLTEKKPILECPHCSKTTTNRKVLSDHLKKFHGELYIHKCPCCGEEFTKRGSLTQHVIQNHPDYRPFICETCGLSFKTNAELNSHYRKHTGEKTRKCEICGISLASTSSYNAHKSVHSEERHFKCSECGKAFKQTSTLRKHMICVHRPDEKPQQCTTCGKRFATIYHLRLHWNSHTGNRPFQCSYCPSDFTQPSSLNTHVQRVHGKKARNL